MPLLEDTTADWQLRIPGHCRDSIAILLRRVMASSVYKINKGINKPIEFKGLKAQYIVYLAVGLVVLLVLFAILYIIGVNMFVCLALTVALGVALFMFVYRMSDTYGEHGLLKKMARRQLPRYIKVSSRKIFTQLKIH